MLTGIVWQVFTLCIFALLASDFARSAYQNRSQHSAEAIRLQSTRSFQLFIGGLVLAFCAILVRCCYRIAEISGGWRNPIQQDETDFIVLDGV